MMDQGLKNRLIKIDEQINRLYEAESKYLSLEAVKEHKLAVITSQSEGASLVAKKTIALATEEFRAFKASLALAEAEFHKEKHKLELTLKAFDAAYLSLKVESPVINRQK